MVKTALLSLLAVVSAIACATPQPEIVYKQVPAPYPVMIYCQAVVPAKPQLPIALLAPDSDPDVTIGAYVDSVIVLKSEINKLDDLIKSCKGGDGGNVANAAKSSPVQ